MGLVVLDAAKIVSNVLPNLTKSKNFLNEAYSTSGNLKSSLPSSFGNRSLVNEIANQLYSLKREIGNIEQIISKKIDKSKSIERKSESKVSSIAAKIGTVAGALGGAVIGSRYGTVGAAIGAATGAKVGKKATKTIVDTGAKVVKTAASYVGKAAKWLVSKVKDAGAKIAKAIKSIWEKFSSKISDISKKVSSAVVNIGKKIYNTGAKIVKGVASAVGKAASWLWNGAKKVGKAVWNGTKTVANWIGKTAKSVGNWVSNAFKSVKNWTSNALKKTGAFISNVGCKIWSGLKSAWKWVTNGENWKKLGASIVNGVLSFVKGIVGLVEAIGDLVILIGGVVGTIGTGIWDIVKGISTGNWDWSATSGWWKNCIVPVVAYDWTSALDKKLGWRQYFDKWAYEPFKSDGMGCEICSGIGYVAGVIALTIATFGVGGVATGAATSVSAGVTATTLAVTAGAAGVGRGTQEAFANNIESNMKQQIKQELGQVQITEDMYYKKLSELVAKENREYTQEEVVNAIYNDLYTQRMNEISDWQTNWSKTKTGAKTLTGGQIAGGLLYGAGTGVVEGLQWYAGAKINTLFKGAGTKVTSKLAASLFRVGLDSADAVAEVPIRTALQTLYRTDENGNRMSYGEVFEANGGWRQVAVQAGIGALASGFGEGIDALTGAIATGKIMSTLNNSTDNADSVVAKQLSKLSDIDVKKLTDNMYSATRVSVLKNMDGVRFAEYSKVLGNDEFIKIAKSMDPKNMSMLANSLDTTRLNELTDSLTSKQLSKLVKSVNDETLSNIVKNLEMNQIKKLSNDSTMKTLGRIAKNLDDSQLKQLAKMLDENTSSKMLNVLDQTQRKAYISGLSNTKLKSIINGMNSQELSNFKALFDVLDTFDEKRITQTLSKLNVDQLYLITRNMDAENSKKYSKILVSMFKERYVSNSISVGKWYEVDGTWYQLTDNIDESIKNKIIDQVNKNFDDVLTGHLQSLKSKFGDEIDEYKYWSIIATDKAKRPDIFEYISKDSKVYKNFESEFIDGNAYVVMKTSDYSRYVIDGGNIGAPDGQYVLGKSDYLKIDQILKDPNLDDAAKRQKISIALGFKEDNFVDGIVIINRKTLDKNGNLVVRPSNGRESTANILYTPYLQTSGGMVEGIMDQISGVTYDQISGAFKDAEGKIIDSVKLLYSDLS